MAEGDSILLFSSILYSKVRPIWLKLPSSVACWGWNIPYSSNYIFTSFSFPMDPLMLKLDCAGAHSVELTDSELTDLPVSKLWLKDGHSNDCSLTFLEFFFLTFLQFLFIRWKICWEVSYTEVTTFFYYMYHLDFKICLQFLVFFLAFTGYFVYFFVQLHFIITLQKTDHQ